MDLFITAKNLEELVRMGVAFRDFAGPIFMDIVKELRELGEQLSSCITVTYIALTSQTINILSVVQKTYNIKCDTFKTNIFTKRA